VISKDCFTYLCPIRRIIVGFFIKLSDSVLKGTESLNRNKGAVNTHRNASSDEVGHPRRTGNGIHLLRLCHPPRHTTIPGFSTVGLMVGRQLHRLSMLENDPPNLPLWSNPSGVSNSQPWHFKARYPETREMSQMWSSLIQKTPPRREVDVVRPVVWAQLWDLSIPNNYYKPYDILLLCKS
jgi:hypothetical protein